MKKKARRVPLNPLKLTSSERKQFPDIARKIADAAVNKTWTSHREQIAACCDFLIQEISEGRI